jgi:hypothetical protein
MYTGRALQFESPGADTRAVRPCAAAAAEMLRKQRSWGIVNEGDASMRNQVGQSLFVIDTVTARRGAQ